MNFSEFENLTNSPAMGTVINISHYNFDVGFFGAYSFFFYLAYSLQTCYTATRSVYDIHE